MGNESSKEKLKSIIHSRPDILIRNNFVGINGIYNLKVLIRGLRQSGKSTLFALLQKKEPILEYKPTESIETANIIWTSQKTNENVRIELWDVVDKSQLKEKRLTIDLLSELSKNDIKQGQYRVDSVDAENVNIYNNINIVIYLLDPRRKDSLTYICKDLVYIKHDVAIVVLINFNDRRFEWELTDNDILTYINSERESTNRSITIINTCLTNKYGIDIVSIYIEQYFYKLRMRLLQEETINSSKIQTQLNSYMNDVINSSSYQDYCKINHINILKDIPSSLIPINKEPVQFNTSTNDKKKRSKKNSKVMSTDEFFEDINDPVTLRNLNFINDYINEGLSDSYMSDTDDNTTFSSSMSRVSNLSEDGIGKSYMDLPFSGTHTKALKYYPNK